MPKEVKKTYEDGQKAKQSANVENRDPNSPAGLNMSRSSILEEHYEHGTQDMDQRRTRKNGWNDAIKAYLGVLPDNWPYQAKVTDPRIHTNLNEKTARLVNAKLRGTVSGREGSDEVKARIHNTILDFQWDAADLGGSMIEKIAKCDNISRIFGAAYSFNYWDAEKEGNETKPLDPRDILFDPAADHLHNARWVQIREFVTVQELKDMGFEVDDVDFGTTQKRANVYESQTKETRGLEDRAGDDPANPLVEMVTEYVPNWATSDNEGEKYVYLPYYNKVLHEGKNPYKHGKVPVSQLRYYPIHDDIYGESEIEPVLSLQRGINAVLCGYVDEMNLIMRPPTKVIADQVRMSTIEYSPNALWLVNRIDAVEEHRAGGTSIQAFNNTYPTLVAALNNAMGDRSLAIPNAPGEGFSDKTATEVKDMRQQEITRDQYNQIYLGEFLKDMMMQWMSNNQQFLFDDETKHVHIMNIIGKDDMKDFEKMGLAKEVVSDELMEEVSNAITQVGGDVTDEEMEQILDEITMPDNAVVTNPTETDVDNLEIRPKLKKISDTEAELTITEDDLEGLYDYIPDVKSMAAGASQQQQDARRNALEVARDKTSIELLREEGIRFKFSELLVNVLEDAGYRDADSFFEEINDQQSIQQAGGQPVGGGQAANPAGQGVAGTQGVANMAAVPPTVPNAAGGQGPAQIPQGL